MDRDRALAAFEGCPGVPGRFEPVEQGQQFDAIVDFAHNAGAYRDVLLTARRVVDARPGARLLVQVSATTQRDRSKRPPMGRLAARYADLLVVTSGHSGGLEPHARAIADLMCGVRDVADARAEVISDRRSAIRRLVEEAAPGDLVLVLGRGAVGRPLGGPDTAAFDDRDVLRAEIRDLPRSRS